VAGKYCVGDQVTLADAFLVPQVYNAVRWGVDMSKFPTIAAVDRNLHELDAFQQAHPDRQPDAVAQ
jgi:glutathione S-transferase